MSAKMHYLLTSGQVRGLYGCGFHWWAHNPGQNSSWHGRRFVYMRFQGLHNKTCSGFGFHGPHVHEMLLGGDGYLRSVWRHGLEDAIEPAAVALDVDMENLYDLQYRSSVERFHVVWTPYGSLARALDGPAAAEWREHDDVAMQLDRASRTLEMQKDVKMLLARCRTATRYEDGRHNPYDAVTTSLLLFEPWQWASLHAALYSLCVPYMYGAPE